MKKSLRFCVLLTFAAALLTVSVFADTLIRRNPPLHWYAPRQEDNKK